MFSPDSAKPWWEIWKKRLIDTKQLLATVQQRWECDNYVSLTWRLVSLLGKSALPKMHIFSKASQGGRNW